MTPIRWLYRARVANSPHDQIAGRPSSAHKCSSRSPTTMATCAPHASFDSLNRARSRSRASYRSQCVRFASPQSSLDRCGGTRRSNSAPIEQCKELIRVSLTVRAELERRERGRLRMSIRTVRGVRHPGRPAARRPKHLAEILLRQHHSRVPPQPAVRATAVPRPRHRMGYCRRAADRIASEDAYPSAASALKLPQ